MLTHKNASSSLSSLPSLALETWVLDKAAQKVLAALKRAGIHGRFVGGCVRDALAGHVVDVPEVDMAADAPPDAVKKALANAHIKTIDTGLKHGTITAMEGGEAFEITSLRVDLETDGRHATVRYSKDWLKDAKRRDLTINALYADADGTVFDPLNGYDDIKNHCVRFIGDARERIEQDYLRILRFFRFTGIYGSLEKPDVVSLKACSDLASGMKRLSGERILDEMCKILSLRNNIDIVTLMKNKAILQTLLPQAREIETCIKVAKCLNSHFLPPDPLLLLATLCRDENDALAMCQRLKCSKKQEERMKNIFRAKEIIPCYASFREVKRFLYTMGEQAFHDRVVLLWSQDPKDANGVRWNTLLAMARSWERPTMLVRGSHVQRLGITPGPLIGKILKEVEKWWIDSDFPNDFPSSFERLRAIAYAFRPSGKSRQEALGGKDEKMASTCPPVSKPKRVPLS